MWMEAATARASPSTSRERPLKLWYNNEKRGLKTLEEKNRMKPITLRTSVLRLGALETACLQSSASCLFALFALFVASFATSAAEVKFKDPIVLDTPNPDGAGVWFGAAVTWVPDVSGDGKAEILVGASRESSGDSP